jgi:hypothetical protein
MLKISASLLLVLLLTTIAWAKPAAWLRGTWEGTGYQIDNNETWTMRLVASRGKFSIDYPSLNCGGEWRLIRFNASKARFRERLKFGIDKCTNNGRVIIERLSRRQIVFLYYNSGSQDVSASAVLNRTAEGRRQKALSSNPRGSQ